MRAVALPVLLTMVGVVSGPSQARERFVRSDFYPAVSTQCLPPDGGRRYVYPPRTSDIIRVEDRTAYDRPNGQPARIQRTRVETTTTRPTAKPAEVPPLPPLSPLPTLSDPTPTPAPAVPIPPERPLIR